MKKATLLYDMLNRIFFIIYTLILSVFASVTATAQNNATIHAGSSQGYKPKLKAQAEIPVLFQDSKSGE